MPPRWSPVLCLPILLPFPAMAAATFTGNVSTDFATLPTSTVYVKDPEVPGESKNPTTGAYTGFEILGLWIHYDQGEDSLYVGYDTGNVAGDTDGNGNPDTSGADYSSPDPVGISSTESYSVYFDFNNDNNNEIIVGKPQQSDLIGAWQVSEFNDVLQSFPPVAYVTPLSQFEGPVFYKPTVATPNLEFVVLHFSKLPGFPANFNRYTQPLTFRVGAMAFPGGPGIGYDSMPQTLGGTVPTPIIFPAPTGSISGSAFQDTNGNGIQDQGEPALVDIQVIVTGDIEVDGDLDSLETATNDSGVFTVDPLAADLDPNNPTDGDYTVDLQVPWGYATPDNASQDVQLDPNEDEVLTPWALVPLDSDGDTIPDIIEGPNADTDGDGTPNYNDPDSDGDGIPDEIEAGGDGYNPVDTDGDGQPDYTDGDSDADLIPDGVEGSSDLDGDGEPNYTDLDSDGDGPLDSQEGDSDHDGDGTYNAIDLDSDGDDLPDALEVGLDPSSPMDANNDGQPNYLDEDTDDDGLVDGDEGIEDLDGDGVLEYPEYDDSDGDGVQDIFDPDSDNDGIVDGVEVGIGQGDQSPDTDPQGPFQPDEDPTTTTDPDDADSDDDGLLDGNEDTNHNGAQDPSSDVDGDGYPGGPTPTIDQNQNGIPDSWEETDPSNADSDDDGVQDGTEVGLDEPQTGPNGDTSSTDPGTFIPDADPASTTNPLDPDTDDGGVADGSEDTNGNGDIGPAEGDPNDPSDDQDGDGDGLSDIVEQQGGSDPNNPDTDGDGVYDGADGLNDSDGDGSPDALDTDSDNDGLVDGDEATSNDGGFDPNVVIDTDGDGSPDLDDIDSDDDGLTDDLEGDGDHDGDGIPDVRDPDSDNDGLYDGTESGVTDPSADTSEGSDVFVPDADPTTTTDPGDADTDDDGIIDGNEDPNHNGAQDVPADVDGDGYPSDGNPDGDADQNGIPDNWQETDPNSGDSDGDGVQDGTEVGVTQPQPNSAGSTADTDPLVFIADADPSSLTNPLDPDTDDGGAEDGEEDLNSNGAVDAEDADTIPTAGNGGDDGSAPGLDNDDDGVSNADELDLGTNPDDADSDDDGLLDGDEVGTDGDATDHDGDGQIAPLDSDDDGDGLQDGTESGVTGGDITSDTDPSIFVPDSDPTTTSDPSDADTDDDGLADGAEDVDGDGAVDVGEADPGNPDTDGDGLQDGTEAGVIQAEIGPDTDPAGFIPDSDDATTTNPADADTDDDGLGDQAEDDNANGAVDSGETDPADDDTDGDGLQDGTELGVTEADIGPDTDGDNFQGDADGQPGSDPLDADSDDDGLTDSEEDTNTNGQVDAGESSPSDNDTDDDQLQDGTEAGLGSGDVGEDTDPAVFVPDTDPSSTTDPLDDDSDDDGLVDGFEDTDHDGNHDDNEVDPNNPDTDGDGLQDGTELGITEPQGSGTNTSVFVPDADPSTTTNPLDTDTDDGGIPDGVADGADGEDTNNNGAVDGDERDPNDGSDDGGTSYNIVGAGGCQGCNAAPGKVDMSAWMWLMGGLAYLWRRPRRKLGTAAVAAALVSAPSSQVMADDATNALAVDVQHFHPNEDLSGGLVTGGSATVAPGHFAGGVWLNFADQPLVAYDSEQGVLYTIQDNVVALDIVGAAGLTKSLQLSVGLPMTLSQKLDPDQAFSSLDASSFALGDANIGLRWRLTDGSSVRNVALNGKVWLPTGSEASYTGGVFNALGGVALDRRRGDRWMGVDVGYRYRSVPATLGPLTIQNALDFRLGWATSLGSSRVSLDLWGERGLDSDGDVNNYNDSPLELMLGVAHPVLSDKATGVLGLSTGLVGGYGSPDYRLVGGLMFGEAPTGDRDGDGISDGKDACPDEPEDIDAFQDEDGCADLDNDKDGIPDLSDKCPMEPEDRDNFEDADGCADLDNDKDGIPDVGDRCPNDPEDKDGFRDEDGCPDPDNDSDGVLDVNDKCPNEPEDKDDFQDQDGCIDPDNDGDGLVDTKDLCPNVPETVNSFEDEDGCPDVKIESQQIKVEENKLVLLEIIYFEFDKDIIQSRSYPILDAAIKVFKDNPNMKVRIEGHTDSKGSDEYNRDLSQRRAEAVMRYVVEKGGLDAGRFVAEGFGEAKPIATNDTDEGRALNRRIEWVIVSQ